MKQTIFILTFSLTCFLSSCSTAYQTVLNSDTMTEGTSNIEDIEIKYDNNALRNPEMNNKSLNELFSSIKI